jgi:hypothetical protein
MRALHHDCTNQGGEQLHCTAAARRCWCCRLYGLHMQAVAGDNTAERPMWAEKGALDFEGRARCDYAPQHLQLLF